MLDTHPWEHSEVIHGGAAHCMKVNVYVFVGIIKCINVDTSGQVPFHGKPSLRELDMELERVIVR